MSLYLAPCCRALSLPQTVGQCKAPSYSAALCGPAPAGRGNALSPPTCALGLTPVLLSRLLPQWRVVVGASQLSQRGPEAQVRSIKQVVLHERYEPRMESNDIALLELEQPIECNDYAQPACLPSAMVEVSNLSHCYISGWGVTQETCESPRLPVNSNWAPVPARTH